MKTAKMKMKNPVMTVLLPLVSLGLGAVSSSCGFASEISGIRMSNTEVQNVYYGNFSYEGINVTIDYRDGSYQEIPLTEEMIPEVEQLKFFKMGPQAIEVVYRGRFKTTMNVEVLLNQFKDSYALNGYTCYYDGEPHAVTLNQELPEGATISYPYGNIFTNAGVYEVKGVLSKNGYESKELSTLLTILPALRNVDDIIFEDTTLIYNGELRAIEAKNVPEGIEVEYSTYEFNTGTRINKVVNAGVYRVVAHFVDTNPNYAKIPDKEAILTIEKAKFDLSGVTLPDYVKEYDGLNYQPAITNAQALPAGMEVNYACFDEAGNPVSSNAAVGTYKMVASFSGGLSDNYLPIEPLEATLKVTHRIIKLADKVSFESKTVNFDEQMNYSLAVSGEIPDTVEVTYDKENLHYAGEYEIHAHFRAKDPNEAVDVEELCAYLVINRVRRSVMAYNEATEKYDLDFSSANIKVEAGVASVVGIDFETFKVASLTFTSLIDSAEVKPEEFVSGTTYKFVAVFEYLDPNMNDSVILSQESDNFTYIEA